MARMERHISCQRLRGTPQQFARQANTGNKLISCAHDIKLSKQTGTFIRILVLLSFIAWPSPSVALLARQLKSYGATDISRQRNSPSTSQIKVHLVLHTTHRRPPAGHVVRPAPPSQTCLFLVIFYRFSKTRENPRGKNRVQKT